MNMESPSELSRWIEAVRRRACLPDEAAARHVLSAVFETLGEVLLVDELAPIARAVPSELGDDIRRGADRGFAPGNFDDLVSGVEGREPCSEPVAREHASAVCELLGERLEPSTRERLVVDLPPGFRELFAPRSGSLPNEGLASERR
jgi:uncharacterized protein (DUF2267 family)